MPESKKLACLAHYRIQHSGFYVLTLFSLIVLLCLAAFFMTVTFLAQRYTTDFRQEVKLIVEFNNKAGKGDIDAISAFLRSDERILSQSVELITKEKALEEIRRDMSDDAVLEGMENPFSDMLRFALRAGDFDEENIGELATRIEAMSGVEKLHHPGGMFDPVFDLLERTQVIGAIVVSIILFLCAILIHHLMRLNVLAQRKQIMTMQLVGGHPSFIRRPFLKGALRMATLAWLLAVIVCVAVLLTIIGTSLSLDTWRAVATGAAILLFLSATVCWLSTWVAVHRVLETKT